MVGKPAPLMIDYLADKFQMDKVRCGACGVAGHLRCIACMGAWVHGCRGGRTHRSSHW